MIQMSKGNGGLGTWRLRLPPMESINASLATLEDRAQEMRAWLICIFVSVLRPSSRCQSQHLARARACTAVLLLLPDFTALESLEKVLIASGCNCPLRAEVLGAGSAWHVLLRAWDVAWAAADRAKRPKNQRDNEGHAHTTNTLTWTAALLDPDSHSRTYTRSGPPGNNHTSRNPTHQSYSLPWRASLKRRATMAAPSSSAAKRSPAPTLGIRMFKLHKRLRTWSSLPSVPAAWTR